jgi:hypothetical protein
MTKRIGDFAMASRVQTRGQKMRSFRLIALVIPAVVASAPPSRAQSAAEKNLAAKTNCADYKKSGGQWTGGLNAKIGDSAFTDMSFGRDGISIDGADLATVLDQKCAK